MVCVSFYVICIVEFLVSSVICRFQGLSYSHVPECIEFSFILFIHHNIHFYFELCTYCNILDIYLSWNMNSVKYLFYMELLNYLFCDMFGGILECYGLTHVLPYPDPTRHSHAWVGRHCYPIGCVIKSTHGAYVVVVQLLTFLMLHFIMEWWL